MTTGLTHLIEILGYFGVFLGMALESACIPLPSEVIMPFAGYLAWTGSLSFPGVVIAGTLGNVVGSIAAYYVGVFGGRPFLQKYGRLIRVSDKHVLSAEKWFAKRGDMTVLVGRLLPIVRTFISLPAGMSRMPVGRFVLFTLIGSIPWVLVLGFAGLSLGSQWDTIRNYMHPFTYAVAIVLVVLVVGYLLIRRKTTK